ncbi:hypothetical protein [Cupriavidus necator]
MMRVRNALGFAAMVALAGCTYYGNPAFDRSFYAAADAMRDQGLAITTQEPGAGTVVGTKDGDAVTASVRQQADGSVRVEFNAASQRDPGLLDRISRSYDRRMGAEAGRGSSRGLQGTAGLSRSR